MAVGAGGPVGWAVQLVRPVRRTGSRKREPGLGTIPPERLRVNPGCGLKARAGPETKAPLENLAAAARTAREERPRPGPARLPPPKLPVGAP
ncbi:hypothetical protein ACFU6R_06705 [Streptomyces sp. NPDC057499]|uniref:hypothetical protein n=1 Tax=Streptomyces sp. NPDC057499 TaxID=3346150 RepID=UPI0036CE5487